MLHGQLNAALEQTSKDYTLASDEYSKALGEYLKAKSEYETLFAKKSIERKVKFPEESATDRKQEVIVLLEVEKIKLTVLEANSEAAKAHLGKIETNKQLIREQCKLASSEAYSGQGETVSKPRFK